MKRPIQRTQITITNITVSEERKLQRKRRVRNKGFFFKKAN